MGLIRNRFVNMETVSQLPSVGLELDRPDGQHKDHLVLLPAIRSEMVH